MSTPASWADVSTDNCSIARTLQIVGEKWTLLVLRDAFNGFRRFEDLQNRLGVARQVLADRLDRLVSEGILERRPYREPGQRTRHEYRLTDKGRDLYPALVALMHWGDRYVADPEGAPVLLTHRDCGAPVRVTITCEDEHRVGSPREITARPGPGAKLRTA
jgi:DNA-binding HxlR family transcriptional regulator